jgi:hypothetical protein
MKTYADLDPWNRIQVLRLAIRIALGLDQGNEPYWDLAILELQREKDAPQHNTSECS